MRSRGGATARQREILDWVEGFRRRRGYAPSLREIGEAFGMRSTASVHHHVQALVERGYLEQERGKGRTYRATGRDGEGEAT